MNRIIVGGSAGWLRTLSAVVVVLALGAMGGYWIASKPSETQPGAGEMDSSGGGVVWYTCGMHPQVLQREPGNCPICGMKLTPMKSGDETVAASTSGPQERKVLYWRDPMEPSYVSDRPGKSPMGMDLVPVYADAGETVGGAVLRIDPVTIQNMGIRTARVRRGPLVKTIRTVGRIDYDEQRLVFVDTKIMGWIEKLHVDQTGQSVRTGDPLFEIYSPDLWQAQIEFISAARKLPTLEKSTFLEAAEDARRMVEATRMKLDYFDVSADQIARLQETLIPEKALQIRSPADGIVAEKMIQEGMRVMPGMRLYTIADLSRVWVYVDIYEYQLPWVHVGQPATMSLPYIAGKVFRGQVTYVYPYLQKQSRVIKVRLEFENPTQELKPDMYANVTLEGLLNEAAILVPREGYIDSGMRKVAFIDLGNGKFEPRDIQVGVEGEGGTVEVLLGLDEGDVVVTSGQFLLDSESKLKEAVAKMMEPVRVSAPGHRGGIATRAGALPGEPVPGDSQSADSQESHVDRTPGSQPGVGPPSSAAFACPMDRHPDESDPALQGAYFADKPGECPRCGMKLKPIDELPWARAVMAAHGGEVAYTCPQHPNVFSESPGECPRCGGTLEPFEVLYTCRNSRHAEESSPIPDRCSRCGEPLAAYRGPWLGVQMARLNPQPAMTTTATAASRPAAETAEGSIPTGARYVCPMEECGQFSDQSGRCPTCGMALKPIREVPWAARMAEAGGMSKGYVCPMHPDRATSDEPGFCAICAMQLVRRADVIGLEAGASSVQAQVDFLMEHYLGIQGQLAGDHTGQLASHALGMVDAGETLHKLLRGERHADADPLRVAATAIHDAAIQIKGREIAQARAQLSALTTAMRTVISHRRPDLGRWPKLFIFHCPMAQADWIQAGEKASNPYYGFKMLDCGKLVETK